MFEDLPGPSISPGTLFRTTKRLYDELADYEEEVKQELLQAALKHQGIISPPSEERWDEIPRKN